MIALIQRVSQGSVTIDGQVTADIKKGLVGLIGIERGDSPAHAKKLATKMLRFRLFSDSAGKMNLDSLQSDSELLLIPQFTLVADTSSGHRPGFSNAAEPAVARKLFSLFCDITESLHCRIKRGNFGAEMQVFLINDGPVTFWLQV